MSYLTPPKADHVLTRACDEEGFALVTAIILVTVIMGLGLGLLLFTDSQQKASARQQANESAFNLAEAALNAQVGQLSRRWPSTQEIGEKEYPTCTPTTSTSTNGCPNTASMSAAYPAAATSCPVGTATEAWGSPITNQWTTYVREDVGESPLFNSATERTAPTYAKGEGKLWVRSVGVVQCHFVTLVTLVSRQEVVVSFPENAATANWFETSNKGNKTIVNTKGPRASKSGKVSMRCNGFKNAEECEKWEKGKEQVSPDTTGAGGSPSPTLSATQLESLRQQAESTGTYYSAGKCPASPEAADGLPAYVEGPCELSYTKGTGNSEEKPGFLVLVNGTLTLNGNSQFFGVVYAVNKQESSGIVVELHGCNRLIGAIDIDGNGGINFGSCSENFVYDPTAIKNLKGSAGAAPTRNSFRVLPAGQ